METNKQQQKPPAPFWSVSSKAPTERALIELASCVPTTTLSALGWLSAQPYLWWQISLNAL